MADSHSDPPYGYTVHMRGVSFDGARAWQQVRAWRDLDRTILRRNRGEAETDHQRKRRQHQVWRLAKEGARVVRVHALVLGSEERHVTPH